MTDTLLIKKVKKILLVKFKNFQAIQSAYIYGSILTDNFHKKSDIDVLFIVKDVADRCEFLKRIKVARGSVKDFKLDINIVFRSEFLIFGIFLGPQRFLFGLNNEINCCGAWTVCTILEKKKLL